MFDGIDLKNINLNEMMGQFQDMAANAKEDNSKNVFTSKAGGGMVEISINGNSEVIDLQIDDSLLEDKDSLQILLISAMNDVIKQSDENKKMLDIYVKYIEGSVTDDELDFANEQLTQVLKSIGLGVLVIIQKELVVLSTISLR